MGGLDGVQEFEGYEEVGADTVFHGGRVGGGFEKESFIQATGGRRRSKKSLAPARGSRVRRRGGFSFGGIGGINLREFGEAATSILSITVGAIILCGVILYLTFRVDVLPDFYGSLAAAMVIVVLLFYIASRLLGRNE